MNVISTFTQIENLVLPTPVLALVCHQLLDPFEGYPDVANQFWQDSSTQLILLDCNDSDASLQLQTDVDQYVLNHIEQTPEFVYLIGHGPATYLFALSVLDDEGRGCYLLAPAGSPLSLVASLKGKAQPFEALLTDY